MQIEEQDAEDQHEDENVLPSDAQNNEENDIPTENLQQSMYYTGCILFYAGYA